MDDIVYNYNGHLAIINLVIWLILILIYFPGANGYYKKRNSYIIFYIFAALFLTFGFIEADTYHYMVGYEDMYRTKEQSHIEPFYFWLINILPHNYYLWRFVIWGTALYLVILTFKRYELHERTICFVFLCVLLVQFIVTRGCLGIALMMLSLSYILKPGKRRVLSYSLGIAGIILSSFLHKSLPLFIFILVISFIPLKKWSYWMLLLLFPVFRIAIVQITGYILSDGLFAENTIDFANSYLEREGTVLNVNGKIRQIIEYVPRALAFIVLIKSFSFEETPPNYIKILFQYSFLLFYVALLFYGQNVSAFIASRTIHMMCFPLTIVLTYYLTNRKITIISKVAMLFFFLSTLYTFLYRIYKWY